VAAAPQQERRRNVPCFFYSQLLNLTHFRHHNPLPNIYSPPTLTLSQNKKNFNSKNSETQNEIHLFRCSRSRSRRYHRQRPVRRRRHRSVSIDFLDLVIYRSRIFCMYSTTTPPSATTGSASTGSAAADTSPSATKNAASNLKLEGLVFGAWAAGLAALV